MFLPSIKLKWKMFVSPSRWVWLYMVLLRLKFDGGWWRSDGGLAHTPDGGLASAAVNEPKWITPDEFSRLIMSTRYWTHLSNRDGCLVNYTFTLSQSWHKTIAYSLHALSFIGNVCVSGQSVRGQTGVKALCKTFTNHKDPWHKDSLL